MDIKNRIKEKLVESYGEPFESYLEHKYEDKIIEVLVNGDFKTKEEWLTYNQVIVELKHSIKDLLKVKQLQYGLTDDKAPNDACIEVMEDIKTLNSELSRLYDKIKSF